MVSFDEKLLILLKSKFIHYFSLMAFVFWVQEIFAYLKVYVKDLLFSSKQFYGFSSYTDDQLE